MKNGKGRVASSSLFPIPIRIIREIRGLVSSRTAVAVSVALLACLPGPAEGADASLERKIGAIRQRYAKVERELRRCRQVTSDLPGESAEGGELTGYFKGGSLRKLLAKFYGESGQAREEYYFWDGRLFFVLRTESRYTKPLSGLVKTRTEERFYFDEGKLIRWLGPDKKPTVLGLDAEERSRELFAQARKFSDMVR